MKKIIVIMTAVSMLLSLTACSEIAGSSEDLVPEELEEIGEKVGDLLGIDTVKDNTDTVKKYTVSLFKEGLLAVKVDGKWGYIDESGSFVIEPQFTRADNFQYNGFAIVEAIVSVDDGSYQRYGVIDKNGDFVVEPEYYEIEAFDSKGLARAAKNMRTKTDIFGYEQRIYDWGLVNENGEVVLEPKYNMISEFDENGIAKIGNDPQIQKIYTGSGNTYYEETVYSSGLMNENFEVVFDISQNQGIGDFHCGWAAVNSMPANYVDINGNLMIDYSQTGFDETLQYYTDVCDFTDDGIAHVRCGEAYAEGYIDTEGAPVIDIKYFDLGDFAENGLTYAYMFGEKYGYIDKKGNYVIEPQFDKAEDFDSSGYAKVNMGYEFDTVEGTLADGKWGVIDESGNYLAEPVYDEITEIKNDVAIVRSGDKYGFVNLKNGIAVEPEYDRVYFYLNRYIRCISGSSKMDMDLDGNIDNIAENAVWCEINGENFYVGSIDPDGNMQFDDKCLEKAEFPEGVRTFACNYGSIIYNEGNATLLRDTYMNSRFNVNGIALVYYYDHDIGQNLYGFVDSNGEYITEPQYTFDYASMLYDDNYVVIAKDGGFEIINEYGENIFDRKFEGIADPYIFWTY